MKAFLCFVLAALSGAFVVFGCGPFFPKIVFTYKRHPDLPRTAYLNGDLGVVMPTYDVEYLVIAYRYLQGPRLTADEKQQVLDFWKDRETGQWDKSGTDWVEKWRAAREQVAAPVVTAGKYSFDPKSNSFALNCADDAFRTAYETLQDRRSKFGAKSAAFLSWAKAQDIVFDDCDGEGSVPEADASLPPILQRDREYQIAAAHFYLSHTNEAEAGFRAIAANSSSQWNRIAPYLVARTLSRDDARIEDAEKEAQAVLANPNMASIHGMTRVLLHRVILQKLDDGYFNELARDLMRGTSRRSLREVLWDYNKLYGAGKRSPDDLTQWIANLQDDKPAARARAVNLWRSKKSPPWLVAALSHAQVEDAASNELMQAASGVSPNQPSYLTVRYHALRLQLDRHETRQSREELDRILTAKLPKSSMNLFRGLRMRAAPDFNEFLKFATRRSVLITLDENTNESPDDESSSWVLRDFPKIDIKNLLDRDSIKILNERTPMRLLRELALSGNVPEFYKVDFVTTAFTRALLLNDAEDGVLLAQRLVELKADRQGYLDTYLKAPGSESRQFAGIFWVLHHPEARPYLASSYVRWEKPGRIESFRDNWWCPVDMAAELNSRHQAHDEWRMPVARDDVDAPRWFVAALTDEQRKQAKAEMAKLAATKSGPDWLIAQTMAWTMAHPKDPRNPEALHYALRSQRYGCVRDETAADAEKAWRYLWRTYPNNSWTKKTNYPFSPGNVPRNYN